MCITYSIYSCDHAETTNSPCRNLLRRKEEAKSGYHTQRFGVVSSLNKANPIICNQEPSSKLVFDLCSTCSTAKVVAHQNAFRGAKIAVETWPLYRYKEQWNFTCSKCSQDRLEPTKQARIYNSGSCCANGPAEFEAWEKRNGLSKPVSLTQKIINTVLGQDKSAIPTRARTYPGRTVLPYTTRPENAGGTIAPPVPNVDKDLPSLPRSATPPYYEDAGIDVAQWLNNVSTGHGTIPPPSYSPLPERPLHIGRYATVRNRKAVGSPAQPDASESSSTQAVYLRGGGLERSDTNLPESNTIRSNSFRAEGRNSRMASSRPLAGPTYPNENERPSTPVETYDTRPPSSSNTSYTTKGKLQSNSHYSKGQKSSLAFSRGPLNPTYPNEREAPVQLDDGPNWSPVEHRRPDTSGSGISRMGHNIEEMLVYTSGPSREQAKPRVGRAEKPQKNENEIPLSWEGKL